MPAVYIATMMDAGNVKWRPRSSEGLGEDGPSDRTMVIDFSGNVAALPYLTKASYGDVLDIRALARDVDILFNKEWLKGIQYAKADIVLTENGARIVAKIEPPATEEKT